MAKPPAILIVDDNVDLAENLAEALELAGARVVTASNGREALALLDRELYDLVLTDMRMPEVSGLELIRALRSRDPATPVIVMSAFTSGRELDEARDQGAIDVLEKPVDLRFVMGLVARLRDGCAVLVVEDDTALRTNLTEALFRLEGVVPLSATTAAEARSVAERVRPPVVVLDLRLPDERGSGLLEQLQAMDGVRIIVTTGYPADVAPASPETVVLEKPVSIPALLDHVRALT